MEKKITQAELAKILQVSQGTISKYVNGRRQLKFSQALKIKKALEWSDEDIKNFMKQGEE